MSSAGNISALAARMSAERSRRMSLADFVRQSWHVLEPNTPLVWGWHMQAICDHVEDIFTGWRRAKRTGERYRVQNAALAVPPGSSKSRITSVCAPAWVWLNDPGWRAIFTGAPRPASRDALLCRILIESEWYQGTFRPHWSLRVDQNTKLTFWNSAGGVRSAFGSGSKITGDRADAIVVDDPIDAADRNSKVKRDSVNDWWDNAAANRLSDPKIGVRIIIQQRLHDDDLIGHVTKTEPGRWHHLVIPQEYDEKRAQPTWTGWEDPRTTDGELMCPERFPQDVLESERARLGPAGYASQHNQQASPAEGGLLKLQWWQRWTELPLFAFTFHSWDLRNSRKDVMGTSYVVGQCWGVVPNGVQAYMIDQYRKRPSPKETEDAIADHYHKWGNDYGLPRAVLVEEKASGPGVIERLWTRIANLVPVDPGTRSKEQRAADVAATIQNGNVFLPKNAPWVADFLTESSMFPFGSNDDQVDACTQGLTYVQEQKIYVVKAGARVAMAPKAQRGIAMGSVRGGKPMRGGHGSDDDDDRPRRRYGM